MGPEFTTWTALRPNKEITHPPVNRTPRNPSVFAVKTMILGGKQYVSHGRLIYNLIQELGERLPFQSGNPHHAASPQRRHKMTVLLLCFSLADPNTVNSLD